MLVQLPSATTLVVPHGDLQCLEFATLESSALLCGLLARYPWYVSSALRSFCLDCGSPPREAVPPTPQYHHIICLFRHPCMPSLPHVIWRPPPPLSPSPQPAGPRAAGYRTISYSCALVVASLLPDQPAAPSAPYRGRVKQHRLWPLVQLLFSSVCSPRGHI